MDAVGAKTDDNNAVERSFVWRLVKRYPDNHVIMGVDAT